MKEENERIVEKVRDLVDIVPIEKIKNMNLKAISRMDGTITVLPNEYFEGFFVAKLIKK